MNDFTNLSDDVLIDAYNRAARTESADLDALRAELFARNLFGR